MAQADPFAAYRVAPATPPPAPAPSGDPFAQFRVGTPPPATPPPAESSMWDSIVNAADVAIPTILRVGGGVVGSIAGGVVGLPSGPGALATTALGGAGGSAVGTTLAQGYEMLRGKREGFNPTAIAVDTAFGAIPVLGKAGSVAKTVASRAAQGAVLGAGGDAAMRWAEGQEQDLGGSLTSGAIGAVVGGGLGAVEARRLSRGLRGTRAADVPVAPKPTDVTPPPVVATAETPSVVTPKPSPVPPQGAPDFQQAAPTVNPTRSFTDAPAPVRTTSTQALDTPAPIDDLQVRTPRPTASPEAARLARVVNQEGLPPTAPIPEHRRVTEQMVARFPEEQRAGLLEVIEKNDAFESARRGVQSDARRAALAQHIEMDLSKQLRPGTILNSEETDHLAGVVRGMQARIEDLSQRVVEGKADLRDLGALAQAKTERATLMASFYGTTAEQGRALRAQRFMADIMRSGDMTALRKVLQQHPDLKNIENFAQDFLNKGTDAERMTFAMEELRKRRSWSDTALAVWYANVLSGPKTHLRNLIGSGSNIAFREISNAVGTGYDAARSAVTGAPRTMYASEIPHRAVGAWNGFRKGLSDAAFVMQNGYSQEAIEAFDTPRIELGGGAKNPFNLPGRMLEAEDALMYRTVYEANVAGMLNAKARQSVAKAGVSGAEADRMVDDFLTNAMLNVPKDVAEAAKKTALAALFREEPGSFVSWILDKKNAGPMGKAMSFVVPFVRVPGNLFRQAIENNVVGMAVTKQGRQALAAGGREQAELVGRAITGTAALGVLATWVAQGRVSGGGPANPAERTALMETGWKPYSVNIPGQGWVDYNLVFQPVAMPLAMLANAWDMYKADGDEKALDDLAVSSAFSMGSTLLDQSFLSGASDFNAAMTNPTQFAKNWAARTAQGAVPLSGLSRNVAQTVDPTVRDVADPSLTRQIGKGIQSIVPGASQGLPARLDRFGRPVERTGGRAAGMVPITVSRPTTDPVVAGLESLGIRSVGAPAKTIGAKGSTTAPLQALTPEERAKMGQAVHTALSNLFRASLPQLQQMDPAAAESRVQRVVEDARARVRAEIRRR